MIICFFVEIGTRGRIYFGYFLEVYEGVFGLQHLPMNPIKETDDISYALVIRYPALYRYRRKCCGLSGECDSMIVD